MRTHTHTGLLTYIWQYSCQNTRFQPPRLLNPHINPTTMNMNNKMLSYNSFFKWIYSFTGHFFMIPTGWATCQSVVPWIQEDAEQREVRLVQYKPVKHPNIQNKTEDKKQGGNTHCGEEWHRQWGRDRSNTMKERRSNSQERVTGWSSRGKAERNKEEREQHTETQRVSEAKAATRAEEVDLTGNFTTWLSSAFKFSSLYHSAGEFTCGTISHSETEHFPLKLEHLLSFVTQRSPDVTSQQRIPPPLPQKS